jgi:hypothetical protein
MMQTMEFPSAGELTALLRQLEFICRAARGEPSREDLDAARRAVDSTPDPYEHTDPYEAQP